MGNGEISTYLDANSVCQIGNTCGGEFWSTGPTMKKEKVSTVTFPRRFSKKPKAEVALRSVQWVVDLRSELNPMPSAFATVGSVTTTGMKIHQTYAYLGLRYICATWIACV